MARAFQREHTDFVSRGGVRVEAPSIEILEDARRQRRYNFLLPFRSLITELALSGNKDNQISMAFQSIRIKVYTAPT